MSWETALLISNQMEDEGHLPLIKKDAGEREALARRRKYV
jgi:hypothetical protein